MDGMDDMHGMDHNSTGMGGMMMYFHFSRHVMHLLFEPASISTAGELVAAIVVVMVVAILYEGLKTVRELLLLRGLQGKTAGLPQGAALESSRNQHRAWSERQPLLGGRAGSCCGQGCAWRLLREYLHWAHLVQSVLQVVQVGVGYLLMLVAMTYNGWLFLAVSLGAGAGYFLFAKSRTLCPMVLGRPTAAIREVQDHCH